MTKPEGQIQGQIRISGFVIISDFVDSSFGLLSRYFAEGGE